MYRTIPALTLMLALVATASASDLKTVTIKLPTVTCAMCQNIIESKMEGLEGIESIHVDIESKSATVTYDPKVTTLKKIELAITRIGYDANKAKADKGAMKKLPRCCQLRG